MLFDGARAWELARAQVEMGPRPAGSPAASVLRSWLRSQLEPLGYAVEEQAFVGETPLGPLPMANVIARLPGSVPEALVLGAHYDTKRMDEVFVGANDGASGVAAVLELARGFASEPPSRELVLVFFDGEEAVVEWTAADSLYGSRHLASAWTSSGDLARVRALFVLDMVGDRRLEITRDLHSHPDLRDLLLQEARRLGYGRRFTGPRMGVHDDHLPFVLLGVPSLVVIGFATDGERTYPSYWHTPEDTLDKISAESLEMAGRVVEATVRRLDEILVVTCSR